MKLIFVFFSICMVTAKAQCPKGYDLWLGYDKIEQGIAINDYNRLTESIFFPSGSDVLEASRKELARGLNSMLGMHPVFSDSWERKNTMLVAKKNDLDTKVLELLGMDYDDIGREGFLIKTILLKGQEVLVITANEDVGILYGVFRFLRLMQSHQPLG
ncbi:MAG: alpha-glucuronidase family glycosyl hydrolase, partial [Maribacter sp.]